MWAFRGSHLITSGYIYRLALSQLCNTFQDLEKEGRKDTCAIIRGKLPQLKRRELRTILETDLLTTLQSEVISIIGKALREIL